METDVLEPERTEELRRDPPGPARRAARRTLSIMVALTGVIKLLQHALQSHGHGWGIASGIVALVALVAVLGIAVGYGCRLVRQELRDRRAMR
jgi:hypothetical protein